MLGYGRIAVKLIYSGVCGDTIVFVVDLDRCFGVKDLHLLADVLVRHAVKMFVCTQLNMAVLHDRCKGLIFDLKTLLWQW